MTLLPDMLKELATWIARILTDIARKLIELPWNDGGALKADT
jgi:hypothetical protein